jgi:hypothetical protein
MTSSGRYDTSGYPENRYEPGSDGTVLKNLLGITTREEMAIVETEQNVGCGEGRPASFQTVIKTMRVTPFTGILRESDSRSWDLSNRRVDLVEI